MSCPDICDFSNDLLIWTFDWYCGCLVRVTPLCFSMDSATLLWGTVLLWVAGPPGQPAREPNIRRMNPHLLGSQSSRAVAADIIQAARTHCGHGLVCPHSLRALSSLPALTAGTIKSARTHCGHCQDCPHSLRALSVPALTGSSLPALTAGMVQAARTHCGHCWVCLHSLQALSGLPALTAGTVKSARTHCGQYQVCPHSLRAQSSLPALTAGNMS